MTHTFAKTMENKLLLNNAEIVADTKFKCLYDSVHVLADTTLDVGGKCILEYCGLSNKNVLKKYQ